MRWRFLAIDGGGLRALVALAFLERLESLLSEREGRAVRLCERFDLIGGTSTGAIIATGLALGKPVAELRAACVGRAARVFRPTWDPLRHARIRPRFDAARLEAEFERDTGAMTLGSPELRRLLAIMVKRLDTGAPWILSSIPTAPYFDDPPDGFYVGNRHFRLSRLLAASTAAPSLFDPADLRVETAGPEGLFVDGGVTPHNDPALALFMLARMRAFGLDWGTGPEELCVVSVGTGSTRWTIPRTRAEADPALAFAAKSLRTLITDAAGLTRTMMQWLGRPLIPEPINSEIGALTDETPGPAPLFSYLRLDAPLEAEALAAFGLRLSEDQIALAREIADPDAIPLLGEIGAAVAARVLTPELVARL